MSVSSIDGAFKKSPGDKVSVAPRSILLKEISLKEGLEVDWPIWLVSNAKLPLAPIFVLTWLGPATGRTWAAYCVACGNWYCCCCCCCCYWGRLLCKNESHADLLFAGPAAWVTSWRNLTSAACDLSCCCSKSWTMSGSPGVHTFFFDLAPDVEGTAAAAVLDEEESVGREGGRTVSVVDDGTDTSSSSPSSSSSSGAGCWTCRVPIFFLNCKHKKKW